MSKEINPLSYATQAQPVWLKHERREWFGWLFAHVGHFFAGLFIAGLVIGVIGLIAGAPGVGWIAAIGLIIASLGSASIRSQRRYRAYRIFAYLQQAMRCRLPLLPMLGAAAQSEKGALRHRLNRLNFALSDGASLADAVAFAVPEASERCVSMLYAAARNGDLPRTLDHMVEEHRQHNHQRAMQIGFMRVYFVILIGGVGSVSWMLLIFVMPKFQQIMKDFGVRAPWAMRSLLDISPMALFLMTVLGYILFAWLLGTIGREVVSARLRRWSPIRTVIDYFRWYLPVLGNQERDRGLADVFDVLATATENGRPISVAAAESANLHLNTILQQRVTDFASAIAGGISLGDAARAAGLPKLVSGLLGAAQVAGNIPETLRFLQNHYASRFSRMSAVVQAAGIPLMAIVMGSIVLFIALSVFQPIETLIKACDPWGKTL